MLDKEVKLLSDVLLRTKIYLSPVFGNVFGIICHMTLIDSVYIAIMITSYTFDISFGFDDWIGGTNM